MPDPEWVDSEDCMHLGRPKHPRINDENKTWHCRDCDTSFVVTVLAEPSWREL